MYVAYEPEQTTTTSFDSEKLIVGRRQCTGLVRILSQLLSQCCQLKSKFRKGGLVIVLIFQHRAAGRAAFGQ